MELTSLFDARTRRSLREQLHAMQDLLPDFLQLHRQCAASHGVHLVAGSFPVRSESGEFHNRAHLFGTGHAIGYQDKLQMTRFETEEWIITAGDAPKTFDTPFGRVAIAVCYDSEFPLLVRRQVERGARLILVPSCTDTMAGYHRVRIACQARALENQCYVIQATTVGDADWTPAVDINRGAAGVFTPVDKGFPDDGILAMGAMDEPQWVFADLDMDAIDRVRKDGQVLNHRDWNGQDRWTTAS